MISPSCAAAVGDGSGGDDDVAMACGAAVGAAVNDIIREL